MRQPPCRPHRFASPSIHQQETGTSGHRKCLIGTGICCEAADLGAEGARVLDRKRAGGLPVRAYWTLGL